MYPRTVGFHADGKTICWSKKHYSKEYPTFKLPCSKCIECRLEYARQWAVRSVHEAKMHEQNSFITLTYNKENLTQKLDYVDFQEFIKKLRDQIFRETTEKYFGKTYWSQLNKEERKLHLKAQGELYAPTRIGFFVTGEYGEINKRPHWHAIIFNWKPTDCVHKYTNERGDRVSSSENLTKLWGKGFAEIGSVTFESAGYVARYAAKKLVHGKDEDHDYHPISKKSSKHAIGKKWLERYWKDTLIDGTIVMLNKDGGHAKVPIPRYYEKWMLKNHPEEYIRYVTEKKCINSSKMEQKAKEEQDTQDEINRYRDTWNRGLHIDRQTVKKVIIEEKFKRLQKHLKGDI
ncbi:replication initiator protein [Blackfly microvirus SF02]|uniref:Replication initiator protein n=1 Tax=Blackfly microvirus SF02 TaxID=2576452 RepID=A0A4V1F5F5_9VIRU|nr:replication initiator protein [Blackfly microvirus SF02]